MKLLVILAIFKIILQETETINQILKPIDYLAALSWTVLGIAFIKAVIYPRKEKFNKRKWIEENTQDVIIGLLACPVIMQLGSFSLNLLTYWAGFDLSVLDTFLTKRGADPIKLSFILSMFIQWRLFKYYKAKETE